MKFGNIKKILILGLLLIFFPTLAYSVDKVEMAPIINLEDISATFEEEKDELEKVDEETAYSTETNIATSEISEKIKSDKIYVSLKTLDKITAKTSSIKIAVGEKKYFGQLEIKPLKCALSGNKESLDTVAYIQVKDLSIKNKDQVFVFNGWTFASSPTLKPIDHPVYDLWLIGCDNI
mgnify:FL=1